MSSLPKFLFSTPFVTDFTIHNLPYGVFSRMGFAERRIGVAIGDKVLDCFTLAQKGILPAEFKEPTLNAFMARGRPVWQEVRGVLQTLLSDDSPKSLKNQRDVLDDAVVPISDCAMKLPCNIPGYSDFYASEHHAARCGRIFGREKPLLPNWKWMPVAYHGRTSSIVVSGTDIRRPSGQTVDNPEGPPSFGPSRRVDYELEVGVVIGQASEMGDPVPIDSAMDHVFGLVLLNDWSARDIQKWEGQPLGPFLSKNFATSISPWIVPLEALEPFKVPPPVQDPKPLPHLSGTSDESLYDLDLEAAIRTGKMYLATEASHVLCKTSLRHSYWSIAQMVTHHTSSGCPLGVGDLLGTGTLSGPGENEKACLLEQTAAGKDPVQLADGESRTFLEDRDEVVMRGHADKDGIRVGFGDLRNTLISATKN
uniref:Fumarylacetoacetase n=1 Tax=Chromera velia CCMP2878 TaxID=1169474 RepID=A0A0G4IDH3_9ALVE|mmetsp:Transcript_25928/g.50829  ORF Transcript_25928/g.50829 Transcript_25928/m.50829 type:complete len:423 (+) Transcript_25928:175-1443(+)|eukprot:Cvel_13290.t1-p1 / transcript=Cvel_13290.t1 / gene=Cvel_13290 / organism=Chromera_velia_CCMP2878 / gene_product=Fumarylacetoacetase, putative / transcript_product=Fumarylacetoacetase, putative / location=Cvel_scaffold902:4187-8045(+) / protein_length=422 / sequence_SO=supercontig / SO=protein_coding / is_pseudo=false